MDNTIISEVSQTLSTTQQDNEMLEAPQITFLGSLDDERGTEGFELENQAQKPFLAIIYTGI